MEHLRSKSGKRYLCNTSYTLEVDYKQTVATSCFFFYIFLLFSFNRNAVSFHRSDAERPKNPSSCRCARDDVVASGTGV